MKSSDLYLEWLSEIFNDTKHRAVSLRQLSFLLHQPQACRIQFFGGIIAPVRFPRFHSVQFPELLHFHSFLLPPSCTPWRRVRESICARENIFILTRFCWRVLRYFRGLNNLYPSLLICWHNRRNNHNDRINRTVSVTHSINQSINQSVSQWFTAVESIYEKSNIIREAGDC